MADATSKDHVRTPKDKRAKVRYPEGGAPKELVDDLTELEQKYGVKLVDLIGQYDGVTDGLGQPTPKSKEHYPVRLYAPDSYDSAVAMKQQLLGGKSGTATPFGQAVLTKEDMDWLARKRDQQTAARYKQFVVGTFNMNNPYEAKMAQEFLPGMLDEQKQIIEDRIDIVKRLAMIKLYGRPRDMDDMKLLFAISSGAVEPPTGNLWDPSSWSNIDGNKVDDSKLLKRGLFSVVKQYEQGKKNTDKMPFDQLATVLNMSSGGSATAAAPSTYFASNTTAAMNM